MTQLERLVQEHAIYKRFFTDYRDRPMNGPDKPFVHVMDRTKCLAFEVVERISRLDNGIWYYDPAWANAEDCLFAVDVNSLKTDTDYSGTSVVGDKPVT